MCVLIRLVFPSQEKNPFKKDKGMVGLFSKFCIAQTTAIIAGFISYPFDTVRRRLQMQSEKPREQWLYKGTLDCAVKITTEEGMGAMFKGFGARARGRGRGSTHTRARTPLPPLRASSPAPACRGAHLGRTSCRCQRAPHPRRRARARGLRRDQAHHRLLSAPYEWALELAN